MPTHQPSTRSSPAETRARRLFGAYLESWACDCLRLRASGLDRPSWRVGTGDTRPLSPRGAGVDADPHRERHARPRWAA